MNQIGRISVDIPPKIVTLILMTFDKLFEKFLHNGYVLPAYPCSSTDNSHNKKEYKKLCHDVEEEFKNDIIDAILHSGYTFSRTHAEVIYDQARYDTDSGDKEEIARRAQSLMEFADNILNS